MGVKITIFAPGDKKFTWPESSEMIVVCPDGEERRASLNALQILFLMYSEMFFFFWKIKVHKIKKKKTLKSNL